MCIFECVFLNVCVFQCLCLNVLVTMVLFSGGKSTDLALLLFLGAPAGLMGDDSEDDFSQRVKQDVNNHMTKSHSTTTVLNQSTRKRRIRPKSASRSRGRITMGRSSSSTRLHSSNSMRKMRPKSAARSRR